MAISCESWLDTRSLAILDRVTRALHRVAAGASFAETRAAAKDELTGLLNTPEVAISLHGDRPATADVSPLDAVFASGLPGRTGEPPRHLVVPLLAGGTVVGSISVGLREHGRMFEPSEVRVVELFGGLLGAAYERDSLRRLLVAQGLPPTSAVA